jgi:hypothetical protein
METPFKSIVTLSSRNHPQICFIIKKSWLYEESRPPHCSKQFKPIFLFDSLEYFACIYRYALFLLLYVRNPPAYKCA